MKDKIKRLFSSELGEGIYSAFLQAISDYSMVDMIKGGVLVGFSGGADSVMLLSLLFEYRRRGCDFPIVALHVNHMIRGDEADRDETFSKEFCCSIDIPFISRKIDVPALAQSLKCGIEECARDCRYSEFRKIISGREDISSIAVAHNADDNLETVLLNMLRGCGSRGIAGIPPVRDDIFRPLIYSSKSDIVSALNDAEIPFVTDSTNFENDYKRNYIRNEIIPRLASISPSPEVACRRLSRNLRFDDDYISGVAEDFLASKDRITNEELLSLDPAVFSRVIMKMCGGELSFQNISEIRQNLIKKDFAYSLPLGKTFLVNYGVCRVIDGLVIEDYARTLSVGVNSFDDLDADVILSDRPIDKSSLNVYKISIQANLSSAIIIGSLSIRPKSDGDSIFYGGMTRKLKKLFNDRKIPPYKRGLIPVICDDKGPLFVPGFGVRDDKNSSDGPYIAICIGKGEELSDTRFLSGSEFG